MRNLYLILAFLFVSQYMIVDAKVQSVHESYDICEKRCVYKKDIAGSVCKYKEIVDSEEEVKACQCGQFSMPSLVQQDEFCGYCVPILPSHEDCQSKCEAVEDSEQETVCHYYENITVSTKSKKCFCRNLESGRDCIPEKNRFRDKVVYGQTTVLDLVEGAKFVGILLVVILCIITIVLVVGNMTNKKKVRRHTKRDIRLQELNANRGDEEDDEVLSKNSSEYETSKA